MSQERPVQLGLCCMNTTLKENKVPVYASRRMIVKTIEKIINITDIIECL